MLWISIGGFAVLLVIFLFFRSENLRRQYQSLRIQFNSTDKNNKYLAKVIAQLSEELQYHKLIQLDGAEKRGIVDAGQALVIKALVQSLGRVVEGNLKGETVNQSLTSSLPAFNVSMDDVQKLISQQESHVRMAWSKNSLDGYLKVSRELMARAQGRGQ